MTLQYEEEQYSVDEEGGYVTLALVLDRHAPSPVTVSVNTLDLQNNSVRNAATGKFACCPAQEFLISGLLARLLYESNAMYASHYVYSIPFADGNV